MGLRDSIDVIDMDLSDYGPVTAEMVSVTREGYQLRGSPSAFAMLSMSHDSEQGSRRRDSCLWRAIYNAVDFVRSYF